MKKMKGKSIVSILLTIVMVVSMAFVALPSMRAEATSPLGLKFNGIGGATWFFGKTSSGTVTNGYYKVAAKIDGAAHDVVMEYDGNQFMIYSHCFTGTPGSNSITPTTSFELEKGAILTQLDSSTWSAVSGGASYALGNEVHLLYENDEWTQTALMPVEIGIKYNGKPGDNWFFGQSTSVTLMNSYYQVEAQLDGVATTVVMEYSSNGMQFIMYGSDFPSTYNPNTSIKFTKGATLTPLIHSGGWVVVDGGQTYTLQNDLNVVYDSASSNWVEKEDEIPSVEIGIKYNGLAGGNWFFGQSTSVTLMNSYYQVEAQLDGVATTVVMEYSSNGMQFIMYGSDFPSTYNPNTSIKFEEGAVLYPYQYSGGWVAIEDGQTYILGNTLEVLYDSSNSSWAEKEEEVITPIAIKLGFNGISSGNWFFSQETQTAPSGYYKVPVEINGTTHEVVMEYSGGQMIIYSNFFSGTPGSNFITPTTAFKIAKDAILTPVSSSEWSAIEGGQTYIVSEELSLVYEKNDWIDDNNRPMILGLRFNAVDSNAWYFDITTDVKLPIVNQFYRVVTEVDGVSREVLIEYVHSASQMQIYPHTFRPNLSVSGTEPTQSFKIAKDAVFTPVESENWTETTGEKYVLGKNIDIVKDGEIWKKKATIYNAGDVLEDTYINVKDLVRLKKYLDDTSSVSVGIGADFEWGEEGSAIDNDDVKSLRELLVGNYNGNMYLVSGSGSAYKIVQPTNATANERTAASELQWFIYESTEVMLDIISEEATVVGGKYIYVGNTKAADVEGVIPTLNEAGYNGFVVDLINTNYYLCGYSDIGTCNAVYEFLMTYFGYECYAIDEVTVDEHETVKIDKKPEVTDASRIEGKIIKPTFEWREHNYGEIINSSILTRRMRFNATEEIFALGHNSHNTFDIVSPIEAENTYDLGLYDYTNSTYKSWYSHDTNGNTTGFTPDGAAYRPYQLCFSSKEMYAQFLANVKTLLSTEKYASAPNFLIGMEDNEYWCTCSDCTEAKNTYGSDSAVMVQFINNLQEDMNKWCKEQGRDKVHFVLFAYQKTESAPTSGSLKLHEDAGVMFAPIHARYDVALTDSKNATSKANYDAWLKICDKSQMYIWSYSLLTQHGWIFADSTDAMDANYSLYEGAAMIVEQTDHYEKFPNSGFSRLKAYLMSKKQWDNSLAVSDLEADFFANYFDGAASIMQNIYEKLSTQLATIHNTSDGTISENLLSRDYWKVEDFRNANGTGYLDLIEDAYEAIAELEEKAPRRYEQLHDRIELEALQFEYILLDLFPDSYDTFDALMSARQEFKDARVAYVDAYKEEYPASAHYEDYYRESNYASDLWKAWGLDTDYKDAQKVIAIELGSSGSVVSNGDTKGEMQLSVSNHDTLKGSNTKYNDVTQSILSSKLYTQGTAFIDGVRKNNLQVYLAYGDYNLRLHTNWVANATSVVIPKNTTFVTFSGDTSYIITFNKTYIITKSGSSLTVTTE